MKNLKITVNGIEYKVKVEEMETSENESINSSNSGIRQVSSNDNRVNNRQISNGVTSGNQKPNLGEPINAPMPGTIVSVNVSEGQSVSKGNILLVLEAMKMENEIVAPRDAVVSSIKVKKGEAVESGIPLIFLK